MWNFIAAFAATHPIIFVLVCVTIVIASVVISLKGKALIKWGQVSIGLGESRRVSKSSKRSCNDCIMLLFSKRETLQSEIDITQRAVLKQQMNLAEQRLIEVLVELCQTYRSTLSNKRDPKLPVDYNREDREFKIYEGALRQALNYVKDEVRRSFKENGFDVLPPNEFNDYIKNKVQLILGIATSYTDGKYPNEGMIIDRQEWIKYIQTIYIHKVELLITNLFVKAKDIEIDSSERIASLKLAFMHDINNILGKKIV
jgi:hypothetical protein